MAFELDSIVPWGRNFDEYRRMFGLNDSLRDKSIASFGDGPASFNFEATQQGWTVRSFDPVYAFSAEDLKKRIEEVRPVVMSQLRENQENYIWETFQSPDEVEKVRMSAMRLFLTDYEDGKREGRYVQHTLPDSVPEDAGTFDIGLSSHFLLIYTAFGYDVHHIAPRRLPLLAPKGGKWERNWRILNTLSEIYHAARYCVCCIDNV